MRIGFIGSGRVGGAFGRYLHDHGLSISGYYDRHPEKVLRACGATGSLACASAEEVAGCSDLVLITTRDDQIEAVCRHLARRRAITARHLVGHMSGAHSSLLLSDAAAQGAAVFSLHPLQSFAHEDKAVQDLATTWFSLEGTDSRTEAVEQILARLGNRYFHISAAHKPLYHLSACMLSNYLTTLIDAGLTALKISDIDPAQGIQAMLPLIQGTLANIVQLGPAKALTGPVARADAGTVRRHLAALDACGASDLKDMYRCLGLKTLELAIQDVLKDSLKADVVRRLLENA